MRCSPWSIAVSGGSICTTGCLDLFLTVKADFAQFGDKITSPTVDVLLLDEFAQAAHPDSSLFRLHLQGMTNRFGSILDVVRIDQDRVKKLSRSSSEPAQNENTLFVMTRGNKFLGD